MKKVIFIIIYLILSNVPALYSTNREAHYFSSGTINLCYFSNYGFISETKLLYYKGLTKALDLYVADKIAQTKLQNKKVNIQILDKLFASNTPLELSQNSNGYYIFVHKDTNLKYLVSLIDYFASDQWESYCINFKKHNYKYVKDPYYSQALNYINTKIFKAVGEPDLAFFKNLEIPLITDNDLKVCYVNDELKYVLNGKKLDGEIGPLLPQRINDRYVINFADSLFVYEDDKVICKAGFENHSKMRMTAFPKWVNIYKDINYPILSYSYKRNKFIKL